VASSPRWLPIQASRTPSPSRARRAVASARPAEVWPPVPPPVRTTRSAAGPGRPPAGATDAAPRSRASAGRSGLAPTPALGSRLARRRLAGVTLESQPDQAVDEPGVGEPGRLPEPGIGRRLGEAGHGVDLVHPDPVVLAEEEVDPGEAGRVDGAERGEGEPPDLLGDPRVQRGGDQELGDPLGVLRLVVVPLLAREDLARHGGLRMLVAEDAHLDLAARDPALDQELPVVGEGE